MYRVDFGQRSPVRCCKPCLERVDGVVSGMASEHLGALIDPMSASIQIGDGEMNHVPAPNEAAGRAIPCYSPSCHGRRTSASPRCYSTCCRYIEGKSLNNMSARLRFHLMVADVKQATGSGRHGANELFQYAMANRIEESKWMDFVARGLQEGIPALS